MSETSSEQAGADDFGLSAVRELLKLLNQTDVTEILIERGDTKLHVKRGTAVQSGLMLPTLGVAPVPAAPVPLQQFVGSPPEAPQPHVELPGGHTIVAPMVGTFYSSPSPKERPFVEESDEIRVGDTVGIIEAMKMMNEIESEFAGRVARILVKNGQPVEYGQPLMVIEPL
jgi:acetyl-CoA carboxylase biotin carboxyl carrier protein